MMESSGGFAKSAERGAGSGQRKVMETCAAKRCGDERGREEGGCGRWKRVDDDGSGLVGEVGVGVSASRVVVLC